ncbi:MAG: corrinoid protein [Anaerolineales bacterium]
MPDGREAVDILEQIAASVIEGKLEGIQELTRAALDRGQDPQAILNRSLMTGMQHVGEQFKAGEMFVPEVLRSARAMQSSMDVLRPLLVESGASMMGKVLIGTVRGDLHDIGKNLVGIMCEGAGFEVRDLGRDIAPEQFVAQVEEFQPDVLGMSALLTTTMREMEHTLTALEKAGLRKKVKVMIGGAPITQEFADTIGADGYASNAVAAADLAKHLSDTA